MSSPECTCDVSEIVGPYAWRILHHAVEAFPCHECAQHGKRLMRGLHDLVNIHLGQKPFAPDDFRHLVEMVREAEKLMGGTTNNVALEDLEAEARRLAREVGLLSADREIDLVPCDRLEVFQLVMGELFQEMDHLREYMMCPMQSEQFPKCNQAQAEKFERCVQDLKDRPEVESPFAVCTASVGCSPRRS